MRRCALIIDDEEDIREIAQLSLEMVAGWSVLTATSGEHGVEIAATQHPDVVLLDVMMPGLDGPATLLRLQNDPRTARIPVVFLTAKAQTSEQRRLRDLGVIGVIAKPFDPLQLAAHVDELLEFR